MFGGAYTVDNFSLVLKALFLLSGYVVVLLSTNYIAEGDYAEGEYYFLLLSSILGMIGDGLVARPRLDLRRPRAAVDPRLHARRLAQARPARQRGGREVLPDGRVRLGRDALRHVAALRRLRQHAARRHRRRLAEGDGLGGTTPFITLGIVFVVVGFAFKVSAVPFHTWAPDTYEGAPTPITAFLAVAVEGAPGFVALLQLILIAFAGPLRRRRAADVGAGRPHHDGRQPDRPAPDQHRPDARLLRRGPGRLHAGAARGRRQQPGGRRPGRRHLPA